MTTSDTIASIASSIVTLGGLLGPSLNGHSQAVTQANNILNAIQQASAESNWSQVISLANSMFTIPHLSTAALDDARAIASAAQSSLTSLSSVGVGVTAIQLASLNATNQSLVLSHIGAMRTQMATESQGIFSHLVRLHSLAATGA
jgi:hypothetical protein